MFLVFDKGNEAMTLASVCVNEKDAKEFCLKAHNLIRAISERRSGRLEFVKAKPSREEESMIAPEGLFYGEISFAPIKRVLRGMIKGTHTYSIIEV